MKNVNWGPLVFAILLISLPIGGLVTLSYSQYVKEKQHEAEVAASKIAEQTRNDEEVKRVELKNLIVKRTQATCARLCGDRRVLMCQLINDPTWQSTRCVATCLSSTVEQFVDARSEEWCEVDH